MMSEILRNRPVMVIEVRRKTLKLRSLVKNLALENSYQIYAISPTGFKPVDPLILIDIAMQEEFQTRDIILIPNERASVYIQLLRNYYE